ncbi:MAG: sialidase family protein [Candidatus Zixiibacteriota bacterium]
MGPASCSSRKALTSSVAVLLLLAAVLILGTFPSLRAESVTTPVLIGSSANDGPTLGIPRWKAYVSELNPQQIWAAFASSGSSSGSLVYSTNGGQTWSSNTIQIDNSGWLDMHLSAFGRAGALYFTFPGSLGQGTCFRKFNPPAQSDDDREPLVTLPGTSSGNRSNVMVQNSGRIWIFTRLGDAPSENVRYHYSDNGVNWTSGVAYATGAPDVRIGSMPYVGGNPALVVLHLNDNRGYEYYLWNGTAFEAKADRSIFAQNMGGVRAFTHNVVKDTTMHLVFGLGTTMHHLWKNYSNGTGSWNYRTLESSPYTEDVEWFPISTVRGDDLYLFYCKKSTASSASSMIYYMKWSQTNRTWSSPTLVSTLAANASSLDPNTCFSEPTSADYIPVYWRSGSNPYDLYFAKVLVDGVPQPDIIPPGPVFDLEGIQGSTPTGAVPDHAYAEQR